MAQKTADQLESALPELSTRAMEAFCEDLDGMLGIALTCSQPTATGKSLEELKPVFGKLASVYSVKAQGTLDGQFSLLLDKPGLFQLSGLIVMLPENKITEQSRKGTPEDATKSIDSIREIGNLMVGSWDRIFREGLKGHKHFLQTNTQVLNAWQESEQILGVSPGNSCLHITWEMTISEFPPFKCAVVFPNSGESPEEPDSQQPEPEAEATTETPAAEPEAEQQTPEEPAPTQAAEVQETPEESEPAQPEEVAENSESAQPEETTEQQTEDQVSTVSEEPSQPPTSPSTEHPVSDAIQKLTHPAKMPETSPYEPKSGTNIAILNQPVHSTMDTNLHWLDANASIETALRQMQQQNIGYIFVEEEHKLGGILSRGDLNAAVSPYLKPAFKLYQRPLDDASLQIRIKWFMSHPVYTILPEAPLWKAMEMMCRHGFRALPVQDSEGSVLGIVTALSIFQNLISEGTINTHSQPNAAENKPAQQTSQSKE